MNQWPSGYLLYLFRSLPLPLSQQACVASQRQRGAVTQFWPGLEEPPYSAWGTQLSAASGQMNYSRDGANMRALCQSQRAFTLGYSSGPSFPFWKGTPTGALEEKTSVHTVS